MDRKLKSLATVDLNLLVAFDALLTERHVSRAAVRIGMTQSALSHALKRLRIMFDDELLLRGPTGMMATPRALDLHATISELLKEIRLTVRGAPYFESARSRHHFKIAMSDAVAYLVLPHLVAAIRTQAPNVRVDVLRCASAEGSERVLDGEVDLGIGAYNDISRSLLTRELTKTDDRCAVVDRDHPHLRDGGMTLDDYLASPHVAVLVDRGRGRKIDTALTVLGFPRRVVAVLPSYILVPEVVRGTDLIGHCSRFMIEDLIYRDELALFTPPVPLPKDMLSVIWRRSGEANPPLQWLLDTIAGAVASRPLSRV